jgi:hypothetical protein
VVRMMPVVLTVPMMSAVPMGPVVLVVLVVRR